MMNKNVDETWICCIKLKIVSLSMKILVTEITAELSVVFVSVSELYKNQCIRTSLRKIMLFSKRLRN